MVTITALNNMFGGIYKDLQKSGIKPKKMILFGSYAKGNPGRYSDVDIAIIADEFSGTRMVDIQSIHHIISRYAPAEIHTFSSQVMIEDNPFFEEILSTGKEWSPTHPIVFN